MGGNLPVIIFPNQDLQDGQWVAWGVFELIFTIYAMEDKATNRIMKVEGGADIGGKKVKDNERKL